MEEDKQKIIFRNIYNQYFSFWETIEGIVSYIKEEPRRTYKITIGSDSRASAESAIVSAVAVLKVGNGGRYFWAVSKTRKFYSLKERIYQETISSATLAQEVKSALKEKLGEEFFWNNQISVHIDIGKNGPTAELIEGATGMIKGLGFIPVIKPDSFAASIVADRHT